MDKLLYDADHLRSLTIPGGRVIFFLFCRAVGIVTKRLLEVCGGRRLDSVCIVALPFGDNISRAGGPDEREAYEKATGEKARGCAARWPRETAYWFYFWWGVQGDRDVISRQRHKEVFINYTKLIRPVAVSSTRLCGGCDVGEVATEVPACSAGHKACPRCHLAVSPKCECSDCGG